MLAKGFMSLCFGDRIWGGNVGGRTEPQHRGVVQPGYSWPVQEVGFFAAGPPEGEVGKASPDSSEGSRGQGLAGQRQALKFVKAGGGQPGLRLG